MEIPWKIFDGIPRGILHGDAGDLVHDVVLSLFQMLPVLL